MPPTIQVIGFVKINRNKVSDNATVKDITILYAEFICDLDPRLLMVT